ncbi:MAG: hypothetical protein EPO52_01395 [Herbiconiux sp.]|uniref:hypothetical protein n=1 Tax=Herbiconiux sp. TaxID=1871186 RepID=UPI0011F49460|nr:hypothetical protein [Herbiconiux sp.]TAJ50011.1 MAG: hypothetical protein EPO52_01395 [Herbiconiux sp.]
MKTWRTITGRVGSGRSTEAALSRLDIMPILSAGRHRSPRSGACFMEFASYLAGERWSDHPSCTHAGLAHLARAVNDLTSNGGRNRLASLIPSVIGLTSDDPRLELVLAVNGVAAALPDAPLDRQHALAVGGLVCQDALRRSEPVDGFDISVVTDRFDRALLDAPEASTWARTFLERNSRWRRTEVTSRQTHATIAMAVDGVRSACVPYPDDRLRDLLATSIELCTRFVAAEKAAAAARTLQPETGSAPVRGDLVRHP